MVFNADGYRRAIEAEFTIINKDSQEVPFTLWDEQVQLLKELTEHNVILKDRKVGISSLMLAVGTLKFILGKNERVVCMSFDADASGRMLERAKHFIESYERKNGVNFQKSGIMKYNSKYEMVMERVNAETGEKNINTFRIGSARSDSFGRGDDITFLHLTEVALATSLPQLLAGAAQAVVNNAIISLETTGNGFNDFKTFWEGAINGDNGYKPFFFGWPQHKEYRLHVPDTLALSGEEIEFMNRAGLDREQMMWRRNKLKEFTTEDLFKQEYPATWQEAFISSGNPVFNTTVLDWYISNKAMVYPAVKVGNLIGAKPVVLQDEPRGNLHIWRMPEGDGQYIIGADPSNGTFAGDYSCAQVLDRRSYEQVAVLHYKAEPDEFGRDLFKLGKFYNEAFLWVERNSMGIATIITLRDMGYNNLGTRELVGGWEDASTNELGWSTDGRTKPIMIVDLGESVRGKQIILHDGDTLNEMMSYQYDASGSANGAGSSHDDRVTSLMIANQGYKRVPLEHGRGNPIARENTNQLGGALNDMGLDTGDSDVNMI